MFGNIAGHWWVILIIVVLLFGAPKLPALARSLGQSMKIFRNEIKTGSEDAPVANTPSANTSAANTQAATDSSASVVRPSSPSANDSGDTAAKP